MIQSTSPAVNYGANNVNLLSSSQTKATQTSSQTQQDATTSQSTDVSAAYSVEISAKGVALNSQNSLSSAADKPQATVATDSSQPLQTDARAQQPSISKAYSVEISQAGAKLSSPNSSSTSIVTKASSNNSDSSDSSSTESLSQYSDSQLQQMVSNGKISQSDYNTETMKRKAAKETPVAPTSTNHTIDNSDVSQSA